MSRANRTRVALVAAVFVFGLFTPAVGAIESPPGGEVSGTLTFPVAPPTETQLTALRVLGLRAQGAKRLPLAFVRGTQAQIASAVRTGAAMDFYPDEPINYASTTSNHAMGVDKLHDLGFTGEGMTVAVVDSGIDATHPDLADHVLHNVTIVNADVVYGGASQDQMYVAVDEGPGSNTDRNGGHGTLVAGVLAADGTTDASQVGVAPDAALVGYTTSDPYPPMLVAFDHILDHPEWGIDVVNNSWGRYRWASFDPGHPVNIATKALTDHGIVVVWSAGNWGAAETEMTMNSYSLAPWNISVAASSMRGARSGYSSNGLMMDNSQPTAPTGGHVRFTGDRIGMYHPTVAAPGGPLSTSCTQPNMWTTGCVPGGTGTQLGIPALTGVVVEQQYGTSFSAPHVAGLAALLLQARPSLSVAQLRAALEATASQPTDGSPFWQMGYGVADAPAALDLVISENFTAELQTQHEADEARILADRDWRVDASEHWTWEPPAVTVAGIPDTRDLELEVPPGTDALKVAMSYAPFTDPYRIVADYTVTVFDADGREIGRTNPSAGSGINTALLDLRGTSPVFGEWTLHVEGASGINDAPSVHRVTVAAALLRAQTRVTPPRPRFVPDGTLSLAFGPDPSRSTGVGSPEGCEIEQGAPRGTLAHSPVGGVCHSARVAATSAAWAEFTSAPFDQALVLGGEGRLVIYVSESATLPDPFTHSIDYQVEELTGDGRVLPLGAGLSFARAASGPNEFAFELTEAEVSEGSRLRIRWYQYDLTSYGTGYLFGGEAYGDAGITQPVGHFE